MFAVCGLRLSLFSLPLFSYILLGFRELPIFSFNIYAVYAAVYMPYLRCIYFDFLRMYLICFLILLL